MSTFYNGDKVLVYFDPLLDARVEILGTNSMVMSMEDYAKARVPHGLNYSIVDVRDMPHPAVPGITDLNSTDPLNMFYKYLNAI